MSRRVLVLCGAFATALAGLVVGLAAAADDDYGYGPTADDDHPDARRRPRRRRLVSIDARDAGRGAAAERRSGCCGELLGDRDRAARQGDDSLDAHVPAAERGRGRGAHPPWCSRCRRACRRSAVRPVQERADGTACRRRGRRRAVRARRLLRQRAHGEELGWRDPRAAEARRPLSGRAATQARARPRPARPSCLPGRDVERPGAALPLDIPVDRHAALREGGVLELARGDRNATCPGPVAPWEGTERWGRPARSGRRAGARTVRESDRGRELVRPLDDAEAEHLVVERRERGESSP